MKIQVTFRNSKFADPGIVMENVGIEVGKGCLAIFPGGSSGDGSCDMYPLDLIEKIHVEPGPEEREPTPIRSTTN